MITFAQVLINQARAQVIVPPRHPAAGYWFGGGNLLGVPSHNLVLVGRYRNQGDSRTGLAAGERGCELAIFRSVDQGRSWSKTVSFSKSDLSSLGRRVLSIEGSALHWTNGAIELFVSSELDGIGYPSDLESFLKPGCGVWTIQRLAAESVDELRNAPIETVFASRDPEHLHVKDPRVYDDAGGGLVLM